MEKIKLLVSLIILFAGLDTLLLLNEVPWYIGLLLLLIGFPLLFFILRKISKKYFDEENRLSIKLLSTITKRKYFQFIGIVIIFFVIILNLSGSRTSQRIGNYDIIAILLGMCFLFYKYVPKKFKKEGDFIFLFLLFLTLIIILPVVLYGIIMGNYEKTTMEFTFQLVHYLLAKPVTFLLTITGIKSATDGATVYFWMSNGSIGRVEIWIACSGIYSFAIFTSAFSSFVITEYRKIDINTAMLLLLGILTAYISNILRMYIIICVGSVYGEEALLWTHIYLGELIFVIWIGIFWYLLFRVYIKEQTK
ncbi:MAG: exosortase/archaeosortase family protein [Candidatus Thermoplasmatota archaeon]